MNYLTTVTFGVTLGPAVTTTSASTSLTLGRSLTETKATNLTLTKGLCLLLHFSQGVLKVLGLSPSPPRCLSNSSRPSGSKSESLFNSFAHAFR
jgi:hypothetical protein